MGVDALADIAARAYVALLLAFVPPMYLMVIGLLWTPFAALICLAIARVRRLEGEGYGKAGALYSLLFFLPWVWLVLRMMGVPVPAMVVRVGYAVMYGLWLCAAAALLIAGAFLTMGFGEEGLRPDSVLLIFSGMFAGAVWFASLRRTLRWRARRREDENPRASVPMRTAFVAMSVSWALCAVAVFAQGIFEYATFDGRLDSSIPLWIGGIAMALALAAALTQFGLNTADEWDCPRSPRPDLTPPGPAYIAPFLHLYLLIVVPALIALAGWVFVVILWLSLSR